MLGHSSGKIRQIIVISLGYAEARVVKPIISKLINVQIRS